MTYTGMQRFLREISWLQKLDKGEGQSVGDRLAEMAAARAEE